MMHCDQPQGCARTILSHSHSHLPPHILCFQIYILHFPKNLKVIYNVDITCIFRVTIISKFIFEKQLGNEKNKLSIDCVSSPNLCENWDRVLAPGCNCNRVQN